MAITGITAGVCRLHYNSRTRTDITTRKTINTTYERRIRAILKLKNRVVTV